MSPLLLGELRALDKCERAAIALANVEWDADAALAALFDARLAQYERELVDPAPRFFCVMPEDWAEIYAHPDVARAQIDLGPKLVPAVVRFLEQARVRRGKRAP